MNLQFIKQQSKYVFSSREVIEIQSEIFYNNPDLKTELGFSTLVEEEDTYANEIFKIIKDLSTLYDRQKNFSILELGGGTGKFSQNLVSNFQKEKISYTYTIIDVATQKYVDQKSSNIQIINKSFEEFAKKNKKTFDILILNEALDMWAGKDLIIDLWDESELDISCGWVISNIGNHNLVERNKVSKIKNIHEYEWKKIYYNKNNGKLIVKQNLPDHKEKIRNPEFFFTLLEKINLFTVVHDYWSFSGDSNPLRVQEINNEKDRWIEKDLIPFGSVDVTYSPDQSEFFDNLLYFDLQLSNLSIDSQTRFDDTIHQVADQNKEIFLLFTKKVMEKIGGV